MAARRSPWWLLGWLALVLAARLQSLAEKSPGAYFLPEFALSPQGSFLEDTTGERFLTYHDDDQAARDMRSGEREDSNWDAWGAWSDCSRTCGGGASYSLRRCLVGRSCEGQNIHYKTCSNHDCPPDAEDFRAQQCSAYNDVPYQGRHYEWQPLPDDPKAPCALRCRARGQSVEAELAPKVLDGTRCRAGSLDMCISGICQAVGCDRKLGGSAKEDVCGVCGGDGSACRLVQGQAKAHVSPEKRDEAVVTVPLGSRGVKISVKGPAQLFIESKTLQGSRGEHTFSSPGLFVIGNSTVEFRGGPERQAFQIPGPLQADFLFKTRPQTPRDGVVHFSFYQPISHHWRQTDFFPCTVTCGGGYQLSSAECVDTRLQRVVPNHYCHYYPENVKPKPRLRECGMEPCPSSDGFKEIMPYDHFQPLPRCLSLRNKEHLKTNKQEKAESSWGPGLCWRPSLCLSNRSCRVLALSWEHSPWTACSASCGGGTQQRSSVCVEESAQGEVLQVEDWKCMYTPSPQATQPCNLFHCPRWAALEWSQCTVTCGHGLRYRVVLCLDHRGQHVGGCSPQQKPHVKEDCVVSTPCHRPREKSPVEAKLPWQKQALKLDQPRTAPEKPTFVPEPWSACSSTCGPGIQVRAVHCLAQLNFTRAEAELPTEECQGPAPPTQRPCLLRACRQSPSTLEPPRPTHGHSRATYGWEYAGFTPCSTTCLGGSQDAIAVCLHSHTQQTVNDTLCDAAHRPPAMSRACNTEPCPPRWRVGPWRSCSASCGVGIQSRDVQCPHPPRPPGPPGVLPSCSGEKPHVLRACSQFDCPPAWHVEDWQQCSRTCGLGVQQRRVTCRQQLMGGSLQSLADERCPRPPPASRKACARADCPPLRALGGWSKCSVSCGVGTQSRKQVCQRLTAQGRRVPVEEALCGGRARPAVVVRPCQMPACEGAAARGPEVLIQTRVQGRVRLTVGGQAYLLPGASVLLRCPVQGFREAAVRWERDGRRLPPSPSLRVTPAGALLFRSLAPPEAGEYWCVAGAARASIVLRLLGPALDRDAPWRRVVLEAGQPLLRTLLGPHGLPEGTQGPRGPGYAQLEAAVRQGAFRMDAAQFEELTRNLSRLLPPGEPPDGLAAQLIFQLVAALAAGPWTDTGGDRTPAAQLRGHTAHGPRIRQVEAPHGLNLRPAGPSLAQTPQISLNETVESRVGEPVYLTAGTQAVSLRCELHAPPGATYTWTKDGAPLPPSERVSWDGLGELRIRSPRREDQGTYGCTSSAVLGTTRHSTLLFAEAPVILSIERNISRPELSHLSVVVGGMVEAAERTTVMIQCPAKGVPVPTITWRRQGASLGDAISLLNGSLLVQSLSPQLQGTYVCMASNVLGEATAASALVLLETFWEPGNWTHCSATCGHLGVRLQRPRCMRALGQEVREALCAHLQKPPRALNPCHTRDCPARWVTSAWSPCSVSCGDGVHGRQVTCRRTRADGSEQELAPQACSPSDRPLGRRPCSSAPCAQQVLRAEGQCPARCRAPRLPPAVCPHRVDSGSGSEDHRPVRGNCSASTCDGCWRLGPWRSCLAACPGGIQSRRVDCVHAGSCRLVAEGRCVLSKKPTSWRRCPGLSQVAAPAPASTEPS
ncbi:ADAMTS-like protein 3 isoform X2 [Erinaceus europaeus]|uniref:ADAMTS-like protein 3 isoform X2 n=1 Tax=Erinaceus europaeus TaxID=9365 RepID=A0ABM3WFZ9_ERIEU|nr:ADAMTS-like protein 3 isoform X2 [Erinaceus europaeus]